MHLYILALHINIVDGVHVFFPTSQGGVLCMGVIPHSDTAKQSFAVGRHDPHFRNSNVT